MLVRNYAALFFGLIACQSKKAPEDIPPAHVVPLVTEDAIAPVVDTGVSTTGGPCTTQLEPTELGKAPCNVNADCVLTDVPEQCNACNTPSLYAALKKSVDVRTGYCTQAQCSTCCIPQKCPPHDTHSPAFYRAECRGGSCVRFRWHSGG